MGIKKDINGGRKVVEGFFWEVTSQMNLKQLDFRAGKSRKYSR